MNNNTLAFAPRGANHEYASGDSYTSYYECQRPEIIDLVPQRSRRILDVGCGAGVVGQAIKLRQECTVYGIEAQAEPARIAETRIDKVWNTRVEEIVGSLENEFFDCIILADVIEHLVDPWAVLNQLKEKLVTGGRVIASVPNVGTWKIIHGLMEGRWQYEREGILDWTHLRFFTLSSVQGLFWSARLKIIDMKTTANQYPIPKRIVNTFRRLGLTSNTFEIQAEAKQYLVSAEKVVVDEKFPKISVIILNWNGKNDTLECLSSVKKIDYPNFEIIVVDNGSKDDSVEAIRELFPDIILIETGTNLGYAGGNNVGVARGLQDGADYIFVLNNDTIVEPNILRSFIDAASITLEGIFGAKVYYYSEPTKIWYAGARWLNQLSDFEQIGDGYVDNGRDFSTVCETDFIVGCSLFVRADIIKRVGLLEERFFLAFEEIDWCYRARREGFKCVFVPEAKVWHKISKSFEQTGLSLHCYFNTRNRLLWARKHLPFRQRCLIWGKICAELLPRFPSLSFIGSAEQSYLKRIYWALYQYWSDVQSRSGARLMPVFFGVRDYLLGRFGCPEGTVRKLVQEDRVQDMFPVTKH